jgi:hypothetical protein
VKNARELIRRTRKVAGKILYRELRKAMGLYYLLWSSLTLSMELFYSIIYTFNLSLPSLAFIAIPFSIILVYFFLSYNLFRKASRLRKKRRSGRFQLIFMIIASSLVLSILALNYYQYNSIYYVTPSLVYDALMIYIFYRTFVRGFLRAKIYDYLAFTSFVILFPISFYYYFLDYVYSIIWLYSGISSILEVF